MASQPRQYHSGHWYHVYARGQRGEPLFFSPDDRRWFLSKLDEVFTRRDVLLGSYCLMTNHTHLLVKMGEVSLARVLQGLHMSYAKHFNNKYDQSGHVFQGRPGVKIVLDDSYLMQLVPYIHQNPVEAGLVDKVSEYEWSSDNIYQGRKGEMDIKFRCWAFPPGFQGDNRKKVYSQCLDESVEEPVGGEVYIGSEDDWEDLERRREERKDRYPDRRNRPSKEEIAIELIDDTSLSLEDLRESGRSQPETEYRQKAMAAMYEKGYGPVEIAEFFNRTKGTVNHAVKKFKSSFD